MVESLRELSDEELATRANAEFREALAGVEPAERAREAMRLFSMFDIMGSGMVANVEYEPTPAMAEQERRKSVKRAKEERRKLVDARDHVIARNVPGRALPSVIVGGSSAPMAAAMYMAVAVLFAVALTVALYGCRGAAGLAAPCDARTLATVAAECRTEVRSSCARSDAGVVDSGCAVLRECDARVKAWLACHDGGVGIGEAGARGTE